MRKAAVLSYRTAEERYEGLPDFPYEPRYREHGGLRLAHLDEGEGKPVLFVHGQPTWSFLWRKVIPPVRDAGRRCLAVDLPGFGRSDKPASFSDYSYERHSDCVSSLIDELELDDVTMVVHDWGGPVGLRSAMERPDRVSRLVLMDTGLVTGRERMTDTWRAFRDYVARTDQLPIGELVAAGCHRPLDPAVRAGYDAPFPDADSQGGPHAFPRLVPTSPDAPGADAGRRVKEALKADPRPRLFLWAEHDPVFPLPTGERFAASVGGRIDHVIEDAGHFLQEDRGEHIGEIIATWLADAG